MPVNRIWFLNAPSGSIDQSQKLQLAVGYPQIVPVPVEPEIPVEIIDGNIEYYRRYLNDPLVMIHPAPQTVTSAGGKHEYDKYLRRYLNDPQEPSSVSIIADFGESQESEFSSYLRRYLNDKR